MIRPESPISLDNWATRSTRLGLLIDRNDLAEDEARARLSREAMARLEAAMTSPGAGSLLPCHWATHFHLRRRTRRRTLRTLQPWSSTCHHHPSSRSSRIDPQPHGRFASLRCRPITLANCKLLDPLPAPQAATPLTVTAGRIDASVRPEVVSPTPHATALHWRAVLPHLHSDLVRRGCILCRAANVSEARVQMVVGEDQREGQLSCWHPSEDGLRASQQCHCNMRASAAVPVPATQKAQSKPMCLAKE